MLSVFLAMKSSWGHTYSDLLLFAELQYKLALAVETTATSSNDLHLNYLSTFSYGKHVIKERELMLTKENEKQASTLLVHSATYLLIVQLDKFLDKVLPETLKQNDADLNCAWRISHLVRNAFAHDPFAPIWTVSKRDRNRTYRVGNIISLDTSGLEGKPVLREHYGGPLALLKLVQYIRRLG